MPSVVVFEFGKKPQTILLEGNEFLVGRSDKADICLPNEAVSRSHATIVLEDEKYRIVPMNVSNAVILDGKEIAGPVPLPDEAELQFGPYLVLFSQHSRPPVSFIGERPFRFEMKCKGCGWTGLVSGIKSGQKCPRCKGTEFIDVSATVRSEAAREAAGATNYVGQAELAAIAARLKAAVRTKVVRMTAVTGLPRELLLTEDVPVVFGKVGGSNMPVTAFLRWGKPPQIRWERDRFVAVHEGTLPALKVNGVKTRHHAIKDGDTVEVGGQLFSISTE